MASPPRFQPSNLVAGALQNHGRRRHKGRLIVALRSKPREYLPNSGPPLQRVSLMPPQDSTAYIIERILLPPNETARDGKSRPKRMTYIVGWHDLPAARLLVPAMDILDYVSPWELEKWESDLEEELNADRAKLEEDKKLNKTDVGKRKRARPPVHTQIESAAAAELETEEEGQSRLKGGALSLSTPQKQRLRDFEEFTDTDMSPSRQLERELYDNNATASGDISEGAEMMEVYEESEGDTEYYTSLKKDPESSGAVYGDIDRLPLYEPQPSTSYAQPKPHISSNSASPSSGAGFGSSRKAKQRGGNHSMQPSAPAGVNAARLAHQIGAKPAKSNSTVLKSSNLLSTGSNTPSSYSSQAESTQKSPKTKASKETSKAKKQKQPTKPAEKEANGGDEWVVQRIEADELYDVEGRGLVRYFRVRWEGDWPSDQNPTWEPEEHLPPNLVRNYFKRGKAKPAAKKKEPLKQTKLPWTNGKQYRSVSEAFAGNDESNDIPMLSTEPMDLGEFMENEQAGRKEFFVVDERQDDNNQGNLSWKRNRSFGVWGTSSAT